MPGMTPRRRAKSAVLTLVVATATSGVLIGRAAATQDDTEPRAAQTPASQPTTASSDADSDPLHARSQLVSGLIGSKHDFRKLNADVRELCLPCHTPHVVGAPTPRLDQRVPTTQPLRPYQGIHTELTGWSLLCLGCHDGVTAKDVYTSTHAISVTSQLANSRLGVTGLRSHPLGNIYPTNSPDYHSASEVEAAGLPLPDGRIQCTTCHDAHNTDRHKGMLNVTNERSRICLICHRL